MTRFYAKTHNNLALESSVMGDEETLAAKLEAFMIQMATKQQALEEKMAVLSLLVQKTAKGYSEKNSEKQENNEGRKRNSDLQKGGCKVGTARLVKELRIDIEMQQLENLGVAMNMPRTLEHK
ncbi:Aspartokinase 2 [Gossypium arboreum]|uniref:Aspartokinase 2 n=1 Tax=Gossypium arboreum TaxID=29729 RepID=A0A0B0MQT8_GOSAR|nr:Aspartokinase 2 [Gossypium arboreum]